jgi:hypothetical protein
MIYNTVYCVENLINHKCYVGAHVTSNVNDDYLGSGKLINRAIEKYGRENFRKSIVGFGLDEIDMYRIEAEFVSERICDDRRFYNLTPGGKIPPKGTREVALKAVETKRAQGILSEIGKKSYQTRLNSGKFLNPPKTTSETSKKGHETKRLNGVASEGGKKAHQTKLLNGTYTPPPRTTSESARKGAETRRRNALLRKQQIEQSTSVE